jgi:hypothetical protein
LDNWKSFTVAKERERWKSNLERGREREASVDGLEGKAQGGHTLFSIMIKV